MSDTDWSAAYLNVSSTIGPAICPIDVVRWWTKRRDLNVVVFILQIDLVQKIRGVSFLIHFT